MKDIKLFYLEHCPHCKKAEQILQELMKEERYQCLTIERIDEAKNSKLADQYDYYYVPTFYVDEQKICEGVLNETQIREVLEKAL